MQKRDLYLNQFSNKKGAIGKPERPKKHPIWAAHLHTHLFTKYPPPPDSALHIMQWFSYVLDVFAPAIVEKIYDIDFFYESKHTLLTQDL